MPVQQDASGPYGHGWLFVSHRIMDVQKFIPGRLEQQMKKAAVFHTTMSKQCLASIAATTVFAVLATTNPRGFLQD